MRMPPEALVEDVGQFGRDAVDERGDAFAQDSRGVVEHLAPERQVFVGYVEGRCVGI